MKDFDRFSWPPSRPDLLVYVGLAVIIYAATQKAWGTLAIGAALMLGGALLPLMTGPFSFGGPKMQFRGELIDPTGSTSERQQDERNARPEQPQLLAPPASSQPPEQ